VSCEAFQERLDAGALARAAALDADLATHLRDCAACAAHQRFLHALVGALDAAPPPAPADAAVVALARRRSARVLRAQETPAGVGRELVAALAVALLALPLVVAHAYLVLEGAAWLLAAWLPAPVLTWLGGVYLGSLALGVGALYGLIPLAVAWRRRGGAETT
jgi:hypothetical protein